jgi:hypothetical protein
LAARIVVSNLHKDTKKVFSEVAADLYSYVNPKTKRGTPQHSIASHVPLSWQHSITWHPSALHVPLS